VNVELQLTVGVVVFMRMRGVYLGMAGRGYAVASKVSVNAIMDAIVDGHFICRDVQHTQPCLYLRVANCSLLHFDELCTARCPCVLLLSIASDS
jgi:hypothetical protein